jgi:hypothetical protein
MQTSKSHSIKKSVRRSRLPAWLEHFGLEH